MPAVIDGNLVDDRWAKISIFDGGLLRGDGAFEVVRLYGGRPWALDEHLERMANSCRGLRLEMSIPDFSCDIARLLGAVHEIDAFLRLVQTRGGRRISFIEGPGPTRDSISLATVPYIQPALMSGIKSLSYASNMLAERLAGDREAEDALLVTPDGIVLEASRASFFCILDGELATPPLEAGILDSITRRHVLALTGAAERDITCDCLERIPEAFLASTTKEILAVRAINNRRFPTPGPNTRATASMFREHVSRSLRSSIS
jgi:branched-chain amino acid aminotransferase